jgi:predicted nucleotidyltransferase component of viral defense system
MSAKVMSLKAKIVNLSKVSGLPSQVILQNYMFECFLERLSLSRYRPFFILKGGLLIADLVGLGSRSTMDLDVTIKGYPLTEIDLSKAINEICQIEVQDNFSFKFIGITSIRDEDTYGGYRVSVIANYETIMSKLQIDLTTGDVITPSEIKYNYRKTFNDKSIDILAYNTETLLAEKIETILNRGEFNTRIRDFYDVYILLKTKQIEWTVFIEASKNTMTHRQTLNILDNIEERVLKIKSSTKLEEIWIKYSKEYPYAYGISYNDLLSVLNELITKLQ